MNGLKCTARRLLLLLVLSSIAGHAALGQDDENPFGSSSQQASALRGEIYSIPEGTSSLPDFSSLTPIGEIYTKVLDVPQRSFDSGFPGVTDRFEWFAIRYTGKFYVESAGEYSFRLVSDDGSRLFIDGKKVIDNDGVHSPSSVSGTVDLTRGEHQIEVDYFQGPRYYVALQLFWTPPGGTEEVSQPTYVPSSPAGGEVSAPPQVAGTAQAAQPVDTGPSPSGCTWCSEDMAGIDLTGVWSCDDGGTYYLRQMGYIVWWAGEGSASEPKWANVARGILSNCVLTLEYYDVPKGDATGFGTLVLEVLSSDEIVAREKPESYGGSRWWRTSPPDVGGEESSEPSGPAIGGENAWENATVRALIDEWLEQQDRCLKEVYPGAYIDSWGRACGELETAIASCELEPDKPAGWDYYQYLWYNNWCPEVYPYTVRDYVERRLSGESFDSLAECKSEGEPCA
ncbi:MAG: PA14 domain protein [Methanosaeta sp. PtaB.Bin039]|nr:MAG: PA14 domain protein [Methanosaeta sp. PtaB.Bin039]OPY46578.1 MAG: PA14 domain protein [Methanosaeta sp. PtaU1.Bin028]HQF17236.1 PA14 domain-containing protein [Methanotrichaceae archaeon]HQI91809.1 PA14 domain-containing protein [Methanotrichaceae archaeon]